MGKIYNYVRCRGGSKLKLITEVCDIREDEIIIRCKSRTEGIKYIEAMLENLLYSDAKLSLYHGDTEYFILANEVLYFETEEKSVLAHTAENVYGTEYSLRELEKLLPDIFIRASKSCIINTSRIYAINKNITGSSEVFFYGTDKKVYVSRMYYKALREKLRSTERKDQRKEF